MCLTQIEIFRFIEFHFVSKGGAELGWKFPFVYDTRSGCLLSGEA
jgi:hypothetical protein